MNKCDFCDKEATSFGSYHCHQSCDEHDSLGQAIEIKMWDEISNIQAELEIKMSEKWDILEIGPDHESGICDQCLVDGDNTTKLVKRYLGTDNIYVCARHNRDFKHENEE